MSDFGGHSLSGFDSTSFSLNPDLPQAVTLRQWYASQGGQTSVSLSVPIQPTAADPLKRKTLSVIAVTMGVEVNGRMSILVLVRSLISSL